MTFDEIFTDIIPKKNETIARFSGCVDLIEKYVRKFPTDENWLRLQEIASSQNWSELEMVTHTLKGYSGNIGFDKMYDALSQAVKQIRAQNYSAAQEAIFQSINCGKEVEQFIAKLD